ncbi:MAG TPA: nuclear transport factor 2 family protein [Pirellulales bacterium]
MSSEAHAQIEEIVHRETRAWNTQDVELLLSSFHPDMVWPWPPHQDAHDPALWVWGMGRFHLERWRAVYRELFDSHTLVHNCREIVRIDVSPEGDGALAVVDVDTLWRSHSGVEQNWKGRAGKVYAKLGDEWKMTMHTGLLRYDVASLAKH